MQRVSLEISEFTRRAGSLLVAHADLALDRGLEPGERLLVSDPHDRHWLATVRDISFDLTETHYRIELGTPVAANLVGMVLAEAAHPNGRRPMDLGGLLGLLREARSLTGDSSYLASVRHR